MATKKKKPANPYLSRCASDLGKKGGQAAKAQKKGIFAPGYKRKKKKK